MCGGTAFQGRFVQANQGRSPRVRGNQQVAAAFRPDPGTIPACAGEPRAARRPHQGRRDDPRVCGGTCPSISTLTLDMGRSPRVRGNRPDDSDSELARGTIPACAGEPSYVYNHSSSPWDDPRVCGGTVYEHWERQEQTGRSPRVRGNLLVNHFAIFEAGTIPACAGEPHTAPRRRRAPGDDPRVCGGTAHHPGGGGGFLGRSPRVRGNLHGNVQRCGERGTIPACAGEPLRHLGTISQQAPGHHPNTTTASGTSRAGIAVCSTSSLER